jgi:uncharacterized membrane-anchored protein YhcB (DUF1043 family)
MDDEPAAERTAHLQPAPLRLVDEHGEIHEGCPNCAALEDQLAGAENNVRSMRAQMANLRRELEGEIDRQHEMFPRLVAAFRYWQERCTHPRSQLTPDRMKVALPALKRHEDPEIRQAIRGAEYDPFVTTLKNGRTKRHDSWELIFRNEDTFQSFVERAPDHEPTAVQRTLIETAHEVTARLAERAKLIDAEDSVACAHLLLEADRLIREWREAPLEGAT